MELLEKAQEIANSPEALSLDAAWRDETIVKKRLDVVCRHVANLFSTNSGEKLAPAQVTAFPLSASGDFSGQNPADLTLLVFEVIAERNRNPYLWNEKGSGGIDGEINNTLCKLLYGPSTLGGDISQGVREKTYSGAKQKLIENLEARLL